MNFKKKILLKKHKTHRRVWLTSIITLFIFATSISAYFLVKNSQDIRRSASEPYDNDCTCIYNSTCSAVNMRPCEGQCNPTCNYPAICCEPITEDLCTQGERYCVNSSTLAVCKSDRSGYTITSCASGTSCDSSQKACIANPTPNPSATCSTNGGQCMTVSACSDVYMQTISGTCSNASAKCCQTIQQFACNAGEKECVNTTTRRYCNSERTAWITASCPSGSSCQSGTCIFPPTPTPLPITCEGTCYTNSSCSAIGKVDADGSCLYSSSVCCKEASCEGTCYTNSSCSAIGKVNADGSCLYSSSVCCKEKTLAQAGSLELGESCENNSQCVSGNCNNTYINNVGEIVYLGSNYFVCVPPIAEQEQDKVHQSQNAALLGTAGAVAATTMIAAPLFATSLPALTPLGVYSYATASLATAPAWVQTGVSVAGLTAGWAGVAGGTYACATNPNSDACSAYMASLMADPTGIMTLASATDDMLNSAFQTANNALNQQVNQMLDVDIHFGPSQSNIQDVTDYFYPNKKNIFGEQIGLEVYSPAVDKVSDLALSYMNTGMNQYEAIAKAVNQSLPDYYDGSGYNPGDKVQSLEEMLVCDGVKCRNYAQFTNPVAENLGLETDMVSFKMVIGDENTGHAVNLVKKPDGGFAVIDATNPHFTSDTIEGFLNRIGARGWEPTSDLGGLIKGWHVEIPHLDMGMNFAW